MATLPAIAQTVSELGSERKAFEPGLRVVKITTLRLNLEFVYG